MFIIKEFPDYAEVCNQEGQRLFCHVNVQKAIAWLEADNRKFGAYCFADTANIPAVRYQVVKG